MHLSAAKCLLLVVAAACIFLPVMTHALNETQPAQSASRPTCIPQERDALLAFKQGITKDPAGLLDSWKQEGHGDQDCCRWSGVRCSTRTGHVSELRLHGYLDDCSYSSGGDALVGQISPSLLTLEYLEHLDLSSNRLQGSTGHIPEFLGSFKNLKHLDLSCLSFHGVLPPQLGNLSHLQHLDVSHNYLTGHVPYEIGLLANLTTIDLGDNYLDGVVTEEHFAGTKSLQEFYLSGNPLKLEFSSEWQPSFRLLGAGFADCQMGPLFPAWLQWQVNISFLDIENTGIIDTIPHWFSDVFSNAVAVYMSNNTLKGGLPTNMETMSVRYLELSYFYLQAI